MEPTATEPTSSPTVPASDPDNSKHEDNEERSAYLSSLRIHRSELEATMASLVADRNALITTSSTAIKVEAEVKREGIEESATTVSEDQAKEAVGAAHDAIKKHIRLLTKYNDIKDVGQMLVGMIADQRGVRVIEINPEFGIEDND